MSTMTKTKDWAQWSPQELAKKVNAAVEQYKKIPGIMKSGPAYLQMAADYIDAIANAERDGKPIAWHGTQMHTEVYYAMDMVPRFNELYSVVLSMMGASGQGTLRLVGRERPADRDLCL